MTTIIQQGEVMRDAINSAVDHELYRRHEPTEWEQLLFIILAEYENEPDNYIITFSGRVIVSSRRQFINQMQISLGELRAMKKEFTK
jgi:hypothetical protein